MNKLKAKILVWHGVVALLAGWLWDFGRSLKFNPILGFEFNPPSIVNFILLVSVLALGYVMFGQKRWVASTGAIIGLLFMGYLGFTWLNFLGFGIFLLFALHGAREIIAESKERTKINMHHVLMAGLYSVVIGLFIMISFGAYQSNFIKEVKNQKRLPSQAEVLIKEIVKSTSDVTLSEVSPTEKQTVINQVSREVYNQFNQLLKPYWQYAPPVLAFGLFLILWGLSWIFVIIASQIGIILFYVLKKSGVIRIEEKEVKAQVLVV